MMNSTANNLNESTTELRSDRWDSSVPVEKSAYLNDDNVELINVDGLTRPIEKLSMIDLFSGAGGFSVGCSWSGFQAVLGIDHFKPAMDTWMYNHPNALGCLGDIRKVDPYQIKSILNSKGIDKINLITGGVPCQGFSVANRKHNDEDERNFLFLEYMKFVDVFKPDYIILENVSGMRSTAGGKFEKDIKDFMKKLGYNVTVKLVNAAEYGVPQIRQRLLFVGVRQNVGLRDKYEFPVGKYSQLGNVTIYGEKMNKYRTVSDAISDLPDLGNGEIKSCYTGNPLNEYQRFMRTGVDMDQLTNHEAPNHPLETIERIANTAPGDPMYPKFKQRIRLKTDDPSPTQLAGGIRPQFQFGHPIQPRGLSIRERARLQSFPDSYVFMGGIVQERVQTGNAVPPLLIKEITMPIAEDIIHRDAIS